MDIYNHIVCRNTRISVIGLGYVGLSLATAFAEKVEVIGYDINDMKIQAYQRGMDPTNEVGNERIARTSVRFTSNAADLLNAKFHIVTVPTPVNADHTPNLSHLESASELLGRHLTKGSIVVYESTVYPGVTEEICIPILERYSGLTCGVDFEVGYSPERVNPGDHLHRLETIVKIVSATDQETLNTVAKVYELVVDAGVYKAESIQVAEAAKIMENCQRDINIAFMNEMSIMLSVMKIDTKTVLQAAETKWNFIPFSPGLVGGHCIGVDPYYLTHRAAMFGYHSRIIEAGREVNNGMAKYVAQHLIKLLIRAKLPLHTVNIAILGFTFKENCPDVRSTQVIDIVNELEDYGLSSVLVDPVADTEAASTLYGRKLSQLDQVNNMDIVIITVAHQIFKELSHTELAKLYKQIPGTTKIMMDLKGILDKKELEEDGYLYWRL